MTTCHSTGENVETAVPLTAPELPCSLAPVSQRRPSQATPTSWPVGQPDMRWPSPAPSQPELAPRQREKAESRSLSVSVEQSTFHGSLAVGGVALQDELVEEGT